MNDRWWLHLRPATYGVIVFFLVMLLAALSSCVQDYQRQVRASAYLAEKARVTATHIAELKSLPTTEVVTVKGTEGYMSHYYVSSGVDRNRYTLKEYVAAVRPVSKGVETSEPVEGDRFIVPWPK